jgi:hypothetical protein
MKLLSKVVFVFSVMVLLYSCETASGVESLKTSKTEFLVIASFEERTKMQNELANLPYEELVKREDAIGFRSIGRITDELYQKAQTFTTSDEVDNFIRTNSDYLYIDEVEGEEYVIRKFESDPYRYIMNDAGVYQIENTVYKRFEGVAISSDVSNLNLIRSIRSKEELIGMNNPEILIFETVINSANTSKGRTDDVTYNCGSGSTWYTTAVNNNRHRVEINLHNQQRSGGYDLQATFSLKPYKKTLGKWWNVKRTIHGDFQLATDYKYPSGSWLRGISPVQSKSNYYSKEWYYAHNVSYGGSTPEQVHFGGYDIDVETSAADGKTIKYCNTSLFN